MDNRSITLKLINWIVILDSPDFKGTDADIVREEMIKTLELNDALEKEGEQ